MEFSLQRKIEAVRQEPEHIRRRYVMICVSFSMLLIFGIWLLSVQDSVTTAAQDIPKALERGKGLTGGAPSLNDLFEQAAPLKVDGQGIEGSEFFEQQLDGRSGTVQSEGVNSQNNK
jgi:hypothetical protein